MFCAGESKFWLEFTQNITLSGGYEWTIPFNKSRVQWQRPAPAERFSHMAVGNLNDEVQFCIYRDESLYYDVFYLFYFILLNLNFKLVKLMLKF